MLGSQDLRTPGPGILASQDPRIPGTQDARFLGPWHPRPWEPGLPGSWDPTQDPRIWDPGSWDPGILRPASRQLKRKRRHVLKSRISHGLHLGADLACSVLFFLRRLINPFQS